MPSSDAVCVVHSTQCKVIDLLLAQNLFFFLQACATDFRSSLPEADITTIWTSVQTLLVGAATVLHPLVMDALGNPCLTRAKVHQELMIAPILSTVPVDSSYAKEALKVAPPYSHCGYHSSLMSHPLKLELAKQNISASVSSAEQAAVHPNNQTQTSSFRKESSSSERF